MLKISIEVLILRLLVSGVLVPEILGPERVLVPGMHLLPELLVLRVHLLELLASGVPVSEVLVLSSTW